jgi:hypothetical protein
MLDSDIQTIDKIGPSPPVPGFAGLPIELVEPIILFAVNANHHKPHYKEYQPIE